VSGAFKPWTRPPELVVGEIVRLVAEGPFYRVARVTRTCATLKPRAVEGVLVEIPARGAREARSFMVYEHGQPVMVSTHAFVIREEA
jgi:hypothetical protein